MKKYLIEEVNKIGISLSDNQVEQFIKYYNNGYLEEKNEDDARYLSGRRLVGIQENPNDSFVSFVAAFYETEEVED